MEKKINHRPRPQDAILDYGFESIFEVTPEKEVVWKLTRSDIGKTLPPMMQGENPICRTTQVSLTGEEIAP